jgi:hypothetical protein
MVWDASDTLEAREKNDVGLDWDRRNICGPSTFISKTNKGSPLISDCLAILHEITKVEWYPLSGTTSSEKFVSSGTCTLGLSHSAAASKHTVYIGSQDVVDLSAILSRNLAQAARSRREARWIVRTGRGL